MFETTVYISLKKDLSYPLVSTKIPIPPVYGNKWKREWKGSLPLAFPDGQMYLFRRFCRRIRLPNAHCVKKISELWWRSDYVLDSNLRSTGPLKIVVFFPHSDKAKSNFGRDDHLWWVIWYEPIRLWCRKASSLALSRPCLSLISNILQSLSFVCHLSLSHWSYYVRHFPGW